MKWRTILGAVLVVGAALSIGTGCSPIYVLKAGWAEARILKARRPLVEVASDPSLDDRSRGKLTLVIEAREFARTGLGLDVGDSYTTYSALERDTLAMVLSAAHQDRLSSRTWWFPVVGHVPYKGFFDLDDALREQAELEEDGYDTYLRPTSAFSTLGWFSDPLLSTLMRYDEVELVETVLHELSHNHLFVPGQVGFNESFATWAGRAGSIRFFCERPGGGEDTVWCGRARDRWDDDQRFSVFIDGLVEELTTVYGDSTLTREDKLRERGALFAEAMTRFREEVQPGFRSLTYNGFLTTPLNNATLLSRMRYYHRLPDFHAWTEAHGGSFRAALEALTEGARGASDPFDLLPRRAAEGVEGGPGDPDSPRAEEPGSRGETPPSPSAGSVVKAPGLQ